MVEHIDGWMDGWTDTILTLGFFLDISHVRKVAKKILSFSKYSTSSHSCVRRDGWMDGQTENTDGRTYGWTTNRQIDRYHCMIMCLSS